METVERAETACGVNGRAQLYQQYLDCLASSIAR